MTPKKKRGGVFYVGERFRGDFQGFVPEVALFLMGLS